jgi:predicted restriction endonuclease
VYLTELPVPLALVLRELVGGQPEFAAEDLLRHHTPASVVERELAALLERADLPETERRQLANARVGQGLFRNNVRLNERSCRVTGVQHLHHLRASHIKPWKDSSNEERLHGCNGLLLAPHVDHLFDRGFISFDDGGDLLISPELEPTVLEAWAITGPRNVGVFNVDQRHFLEFHRNSVFSST